MLVMRSRARLKIISSSVLCSFPSLVAAQRSKFSCSSTCGRIEVGVVDVGTSFAEKCGQGLLEFSCNIGGSANGVGDLVKQGASV